ncbi:GNAT family N-acetyltransferase [Leeia sp. TBRC 13508]|uniref:GNAT family N-acetyltransferase n=1 Tax=Leeia speluncae TaxID=2884804 RepID=A0ABS8D6I7_9NEIS|nr:GNAT family N-acetyltransferase [Leeia speluncae]MCB6183810.1 GNAT family N-acetyltransferase [Leeia speluncae]
MHIIEITDAAGRIIAPEWLAKSEAVHRQLRPQLSDDYGLAMHGVFADGGEMIAAVNKEESQVLGIAVFRTYRNTFNGIHFYVDDLVTDSAQRSQGVGKLLIGHLSELAKKRGASKVKLDSGVQREDAHRFYFREQFVISCFNFTKKLES